MDTKYYEYIDYGRGIFFITRTVKSRFSKKPIRITRQVQPRLKITNSGKSSGVASTYSARFLDFGHLMVSE